MTAEPLFGFQIQGGGIYVVLEPPCWKKCQKNPCQDTGLGNRGPLKAPNNTKLILDDAHAHLGPIWYHSKPSGIPYSPNQFLDRNFFCHFLQQIGSDRFFYYS